MDSLMFDPIPGAFGFRCSNPPVLCLASLLASLEIFEEAKISNLRQKSLLLTGYLELLLQPVQKITILTPSDPLQRGCQLSLRLHGDATEVAKKLAEKGVICDVRKPNVLRVSPVPLYNSFEDIWKFVTTLKIVLE
jgi:kynureninase